MKVKLYTKNLVGYTVKSNLLNEFGGYDMVKGEEYEFKAYVEDINDLTKYGMFGADSTDVKLVITMDKVAHNMDCIDINEKRYNIRKTNIYEVNNNTQTEFICEVDTTDENNK